MSIEKKKFRTVAKALVSRPDIRGFLSSNSPIAEIFNFDVPISTSRLELYKQLYTGIGNTGCYSLNLQNNNILRIKMECLNSMGNSHYSRFWLPYFFLGEAFGVITPDSSEILEVSSGSAGISLANVCKSLGYKLTLILPDILPESRIAPIIDSGAEIIRVEGYIENCIIKFRQLLETGKYIATNHSEETSNMTIHCFSRIASEYFDEFSNPDYVIIGLGNGTTTEAIFKFFRSKSESTRLYAYHPEVYGKQIVFGLYSQQVKQRHVDLAIPLIEKTFITNDININDCLDRYQFDTEISNLGDSSLYGISLALNIASSVSNKTIMTIGYDKRDRY